MLSFLKFTLTFLLFPATYVLSQTCDGGRSIFTFKMHHRFSDELKNLSSADSKWPEKQSFEYYADLAHRDHVLRGRKLSDGDSPLAFSNGNSTFRISSLGFLHYTTVELGTPGVKFMVALDTGSDLFWVPCDCSKCAPTQGTPYSSEFELSIYNPKQSSTSKKVTCNNNLCAHRNRCLGTFSSCPYMVSYVSAQTSTSGILVEDLLHLTTEDSDSESVKAYVTFGCGQIQSGSFLNTAAPNGLFGLGMDQISVPSVLSKAGLTADSFSMCFGHDGVGRISFGDKGSPDQDETPFNPSPSHPTYNISVTQVRVGTTLIDIDFTALFDSGTSFTYLIDLAYAKVSENFHSQAKDKRRPLDPRIPFEYCYDMSPDGNASLIPSMRLTMKGGGHFAVSDPIIVISTQSELVYCLAIVKSTELNIIGQNFMTGYRVVFDREKLVLGWRKADCYDMEDYNTLPIEPHASDVPPAVAAGVGYLSRWRCKAEVHQCSCNDIVG
ncbi:Eukaryotic aspartyl protease family protein [Euphorbia peplus]|nr:Eukaryotic aspartyl protease family protein [Euphorbia peplus]